MFEQVWAFAHFYLEFDSAQYVTKLGYVPLGRSALSAQVARFDKGTATHIEQRSRHRPDHDPSATGDRSAIRQRAAERRIKDSAYIAALVRGHVAVDPPLATYELAAFKAAVSV